jgi:hypothetical protein
MLLLQKGAPMDAPVRIQPSRAAAAFAAAGVLFVAYPTLRPWSDSAPAAAAAAFASPLWLVAHLAAAAAFVLVGIGMLAVRDRTPGRLAGVALGAWSVGAALTLTYYGAEAFALNALGAGVPDPGELAGLVAAVRMGPTQLSVFGAGLVLMALSAVALTGLVHPRLAAVPFAAGMVLFLPQFFAGPELRIAHGVLLGVGCALLARDAVRPLPVRSGQPLPFPGGPARSGA